MMSPTPSAGFSLLERALQGPLEDIPIHSALRRDTFLKDKSAAVTRRIEILVLNYFGFEQNTQDLIDRHISNQTQTKKGKISPQVIKGQYLAIARRLNVLYRELKKGKTLEQCQQTEPYSQASAWRSLFSTISKSLQDDAYTLPFVLPMPYLAVDTLNAYSQYANSIKEAFLKQVDTLYRTFQNPHLSVEIEPQTNAELQQFVSCYEYIPGSKWFMAIKKWAHVHTTQTGNQFLEQHPFFRILEEIFFEYSSSQSNAHSLRQFVCSETVVYIERMLQFSLPEPICSPLFLHLCSHEKDRIHLAYGIDHCHQNAHQLLTVCAESPMVSITAEQIITFLHAKHEPEFYEQATDLLQKILNALDSASMTPSPLLFDIVTQNPLPEEGDTLQKVNSIIELFELQSGKSVNGDSFCSAVQKCLQTQPGKIDQAQEVINSLKRIRRYSLSTEQKLCLFTEYLTVESEDIYDLLLSLFTEIEKFVGSGYHLPTDYVYYLLMFHPPEKNIRTAITNLNLLDSLRKAGIPATMHVNSRLRSFSSHLAPTEDQQENHPNAIYEKVSETVQTLEQILKQAVKPHPTRH